MCKLKSAIILKDRVFIPDYDNHSNMLAALGIKDTKANAERLFVRAELSPKDGDVFSDIDTWVFNVDQDIRPDWFVEEYEKGRMVEAVKAWAKDRIHIGVNGLKINSDSNHYIKDCKNVVINNSIVEACDNSTVEAWGNSIVKAWGDSTVVKTRYSVFDKAHLILSDNATFKDCEAKIIYQAGDWELRLVDEKVQ